jgi:hypothetical protein
LTGEGGLTAAQPLAVQARPIADDSRAQDSPLPAELSDAHGADDSSRGQVVTPDEMKEMIERIFEEKFAGRPTTTPIPDKPVKPWENKLETQERIKELVLELSTYCTRPAYSIYIRKRLHEAKLIYHPRKYARRGKHWKQHLKEQKT